MVGMIGFLTAGTGGGSLTDEAWALEDKACPQVGQNLAPDFTGLAHFGQILLIFTHENQAQSAKLDHIPTVKGVMLAW